MKLARAGSQAKLKGKNRIEDECFNGGLDGIVELYQFSPRLSSIRKLFMMLPRNGNISVNYEEVFLCCFFLVELWFAVFEVLTVREND